ncbi:MAG: deoxyguanosinetriphosphate triphosphohydrolase [Burkholderiaceae bacterium]
MAPAPYACLPSASRGRLYPEPPEPTRDAFQRDRDRIVHSSAFRRLVYKTQVFLNHEGDLFRTRLTHSLEVAQLARSMARSLGLNEDLVEAIALAHDLGHTPFGHAGQDALNDCMAEYGGFEHNLQSLRVVDALEERYPDYNGLNLCFETREGILKHCSLRNAQWIEAREPFGVARRFIDRSQPSLEAQLCNLADEIAYNAHDVDDGVRSGLITLEQLQAVPLFAQHLDEALAAHPKLAQPLEPQRRDRRVLYAAIRRMLSAQVYDVLAATQAALQQAQVQSLEGVRQHPPLVGFSPAMQAQSTQLKQFLYARLYRHPQVVATTDKARTVVRDLFAAYTMDTQTPRSPRQMADYIAGMTDRFALREHERITGQKLL